MPISKRRRFEVFKRDKFTCQYCGNRPPDVTLEVDHVVPRAEGGSDHTENLTTSCFACNRGKADRPLGDVAPALNEEERLEALQEMLERKRDITAQIKVADAVREVEDDAMGYLADVWLSEAGSDAAFERQSIRTFLTRGLTIPKMVEAMRAVGNLPFSTGPTRKWKYFCGACWKMLRKQEANAEPALPCDA